MGQPKLTMQFAGKTVFEHVVQAFQHSLIKKILVVLGPENENLVNIARNTGVNVFQMEHDTMDMRGTVTAGLCLLDKTENLHLNDGFFLVPADHPTLNPGLVETILEHVHKHPAHTIFVPTFQGKRGHPTWIGWQHFQGIMCLPRDAGINQYLRQQQQTTMEIPLESPEILWDLDTPADAEKLRQYMEEKPSK